MARKKPDLKAAKAARQKKIAIGGAVLLVGVLAFTVPHTLKMLHPKVPAGSSSASAATEPPTATPTMSGQTLPVATTPAVNTVLTAQLAPAAREGQLSVLSASFKSKDPFRQVIKDDSLNGSKPVPATPAKTAKPDVNLKVVPSTKTAPAAAATAAPAVRTPLLSAVISVNGVREGVNVKISFPADTPLFRLVSLRKRTAKISVVGGSLASGSQTLTLRRGKPLTLVNTADGTRYRLLLVATSTSPATAATAAAPASGSGSASPATTTQTTTTPTLGG